MGGVIVALIGVTVFVVGLSGGIRVFLDLAR